MSSSVGSSRFEKHQEFVTTLLRHIALAGHQRLPATNSASAAAASSTAASNSASNTASGAAKKKNAAVKDEKDGDKAGDKASEDKAVTYETVAHRLVHLPQGAFLDLLKDLVDTLGGRDIEHAALDLSLIFYHLAQYLSYAETCVNPKLVLELIAKMTANDALVQLTNEAYQQQTIATQLKIVQGLQQQVQQQLQLQSTANPTASNNVGDNGSNGLVFLQQRLAVETRAHQVRVLIFCACIHVFRAYDGR